MKKLIALVLALVCVLGLVGCNNDNQQEQEDKAANTHYYREQDAAYCKHKPRDMPMICKKAPSKVYCR